MPATPPPPSAPPPKPTPKPGATARPSPITGDSKKPKRTLPPSAHPKPRSGPSTNPNTNRCPKLRPPPPSPPRTLQLDPLQLAVHRLPFNPQNLRGAALVAAGSGQHAADLLHLRFRPRLHRLLARFHGRARL